MGSLALTRVTLIDPTPGGTYGIQPADLVFRGGSNQDVIIKFGTDADVTGQDIMRYDVGTLSLLSQFGASGRNVAQVDSIEASGTRSISISQNHLTTTGDGYVQISNQ